MLTLIAIPHLLALALVAGAAVTDARTGHIPNGLTLPPLVLAPLGFLLFAGPMAAALSLLSAVACGFVPYLMFRKGAAGGGDVKLMAAVGATGGASFGLETELFGFVLALVFSLLLLTYRGRLLSTFANTLFIVLNPVLPRRFRRMPKHEELCTVRMGVPFLLGAMLSLWLRSAGVA